MESPKAKDRTGAARSTERALLGTLLRCPAEVPEVRDLVRPEDFAWDPHQRLYRAICRLDDQRRPVDLVTVCEALRTAGDGEVSEVFVADLAAHGGTGPMATAYADQVLALATERGLEHAAQDTLRDLERPTGPPAELLERAQARLDRLAARGPGAASVSAAEAVAEFLDDLDARQQGRRVAGRPTGFPGLDEDLCGGLPVGQTTVLGARPSVGKTSFALQVARNVCHRGGAVLFVSLEQRRLELMQRVHAAEARVSAQRIRGRLDPEDVGPLRGAAGRVSDWPLRVNDTPSLTAAQIAAGARRDRRRLGRLDLVVVDYLQLVQPEDTRANRNEQVAQTTRRLRQMGRDLDVPVLLLCQLNRAGAETEVPMLHHLRDSGEIEAVADVVVFLHRAQPRDPGRPDRIDAIIAKQRNGPLSVRKYDHEAWVFTFAETDGIPGM